MKIIFSQDALIGFISQNLTNKSHQKDLNKIFNNENCSLLYSKKYLEGIRATIDDNDMTVFQSVVTKLGDSGTIISSPTTPSSSIDEEIGYLNNEHQENTIITIAYSQPSTTLTNLIPNITILANQAKPNFHWLTCQLAISHPNKASLSCWEFTSNSQIKTFFDDIFSIPKKINYVNIFDTHCNLGHNKFDSITKNYKIHYFTKNFSFGNKDKLADILQKFKGGAKMFTVIRGPFAHGRRIIFENIIITCDNDFWNLEVNASDWNIDVQISDKHASKWLERTSLYKRFLPR